MIFQVNISYLPDKISIFLFYSCFKQIKHFDSSPHTMLMRTIQSKADDRSASRQIQIISQTHKS